MTKRLTDDLLSAQTRRGKEFLAKYLRFDTDDGAQFAPGDGKFELEEAFGALLGWLQQMAHEDRNALLRRVAEHAHKHKWGTKAEERANEPPPVSKEFVFAAKDNRVFGKALPSTEQVARDNAAFWENMAKK